MKTFINIRVVHTNTREEAISQTMDGNFDDQHELSDRVMEIDALINVLAAFQADQEKEETQESKDARWDRNTRRAESGYAD